MLHHHIFPIKNQRVTVAGGKEVSMKFYSVESLKFEKPRSKNIIFGVLDQQTENSTCILEWISWKINFQNLTLILIIVNLS